MALSPEDLLKVLMAIAVGGAIGFEREFHDKAAGFRTLMFICLGATLYTMLSQRIAGPDGDPGRIASYVVAGIGFLGGGVIMRDGGKVRGITTAATVWLVAALGMAIGAGQHLLLVLVVTALAIVVLWVFPVFEGWIDHLYNERSYEIVMRSDRADAIEALFRAHGLRIAWRRQEKSGARIMRGWKVTGRLAGHEAVTARLLADPEIEELRF